MYIKVMREPIFLIPSNKEAFNQLKQVFTKALILQHFDPEYYIWIETNASSHAISRVVSQLTSDQVILDFKSDLTKSDFGQWYLVVYFFRKMISSETYYKTHDGKLLAVVEAFKT